MKTGTEKKQVKAKGKPFQKKYATVDDLAKINDNIQKLADSVYTIIDNQNQKEVEKNTEEVAKKLVDEEKRDNAQISPRFNDLIDTLLGKDFERELRYPPHGFPKIVITVPSEKSNMTDAYRNFYKVDRRTIVLTSGIDSLMLGLRKIRQNLKRPKPDEQIS